MPQWQNHHTAVRISLNAVLKPVERVRLKPERSRGISRGCTAISRANPQQDRLQACACKNIVPAVRHSCSVVGSCTSGFGGAAIMAFALRCFSFSICCFFLILFILRRSFRPIGRFPVHAALPWDACDGDLDRDCDRDRDRDVDRDRDLERDFDGRYRPLARPLAETVPTPAEKRCSMGAFDAMLPAGAFEDESRFFMRCNYKANAPVRGKSRTIQRLTMNGQMPHACMCVGVLANLLLTHSRTVVPSRRC